MNYEVKHHIGLNINLKWSHQRRVSKKNEEMNYHRKWLFNLRNKHLMFEVSNRLWWNLWNCEHYWIDSLSISARKIDLKHYLGHTHTGIHMIINFHTCVVFFFSFFFCLIKGMKSSLRCQTLVLIKFYVLVSDAFTCCYSRISSENLIVSIFNFQISKHTHTDNVHPNHRNLRTNE